MIGLTDVEKEGTFRWIYDNSVLGEEEDWHYGEPNNGYGADCAWLWFNDGKYGMDDIGCDASMQLYICEQGQN